MTRRSVHPIETMVDVTAAFLLGSAGAVSCALAAPAAGPAAAGAVGLLLALVGWSVLRRIDARRFDRSFDFALEELPEPDVEPESEVLLLDDPIIEPNSDSRVVQLFAETPPGLPAPGELAARIDRFLEEGGAAIASIAPRTARPDASAELHQALADIRRSLG